MTTYFYAIQYPWPPGMKWFLPLAYDYGAVLTRFQHAIDEHLPEQVTAQIGIVGRDRHLQNGPVIDFQLPSAVPSKSAADGTLRVTSLEALPLDAKELYEAAIDVLEDVWLESSDSVSPARSPI